jgi:hypothetical protein
MSEGKTEGILRILQHARTKEDWDAAWKELLSHASPAFIEYFETHWLSPDWLHAWSDIQRVLDREGIRNTNNLTEALFKKITRFFFRQRMAKSFASLIFVFVAVLQHYQTELRQQQEAKRNEEEKRATGEPIACKQATTKAIKLRHERIREGQLLIDEVDIHDEYHAWCRGRYLITIPLWSCTCAFFKSTGTTCKHLYAVKEKIEQKTNNEYISVEAERQLEEKVQRRLVKSGITPDTPATAVPHSPIRTNNTPSMKPLQLSTTHTPQTVPRRLSSNYTPRPLQLPPTPEINTTTDQQQTILLQRQLEQQQQQLQQQQLQLQEQQQLLQRLQYQLQHQVQFQYRSIRKEKEKEQEREQDIPIPKYTNSNMRDNATAYFNSKATRGKEGNTQPRPKATRKVSKKREMRREELEEFLLQQTARNTQQTDTALQQPDTAPTDQQTTQHHYNTRRHIQTHNQASRSRTNIDSHRATSFQQIKK